MQEQCINGVPLAVCKWLGTVAQFVLYTDECISTYKQIYCALELRQLPITRFQLCPILQGLQKRKMSYLLMKELNQYLDTMLCAHAELLDMCFPTSQGNNTPVHTYMKGMSASSIYWLACGTGDLYL